MLNQINNKYKEMIRQNQKYDSLITYYIKHMEEYPYSLNVYMKPYRTKNKKIHQNKLNFILREMYEIDKTEFDIVEYLKTGGLEAKYYNMILIPHIIAYEIDNNNQEIISLIKNMVYSDNNTFIISHHVIRGIILAHNKVLYKWLEDLFIAAKLQEGLRQDVVENIDKGSLEAMLYFYKIILDNDLIRYSSVARGLSVWTGIPFDVKNSRVLKQCIKYGYNTLIDKKTREEYQNSKDINKMYMGFWANAVIDEEKNELIIKDMLKNGEYYQKVMSYYFLSQSQNSSFKLNTIAPYIEEKDQELIYWLINNFDYKYHYNYEKENNKCDYTSVEFFASKEIRDYWFYELYKKLDIIGKNGYHKKSSVLDWYDIHLSRDDIFRKMLYLYLYDYSEEKLDELIYLSKSMSTDMRYEFIKNFINMNNKKHKGILLNNLKDRSNYIKELVVTRLNDMELNEAEIFQLIDLFRLKNSNLKLKAMEILINVSEDIRLKIVKELINSNQEQKRLAALEMIQRILIKERKNDLKNNYNSMLSIIENPSLKEQNIIDTIQSSTKDESFDDFYGMIKKKENKEIDISNKKVEFNNNLYSGIFNMTKNRMGEILNILEQAIDKYKDVQYTSRLLGNKENFLIGDYLCLLSPSIEADKNGFDNLPLGKEWLEVFIHNNITADEIFQLECFQEGFYLFRDKVIKTRDIKSEGLKELSSEEINYYNKIYQIDKKDIYINIFQQKNYKQQISQLINIAFLEAENNKKQEKYITILDEIFSYLLKKSSDKRKILAPKLCNYWIEQFKHISSDEKIFIAYYDYRYKITALTDFKECRFFINELIRAYELGLMDDNEWISFITIRPNAEWYIRELTFNQQKILKGYPKLMELTNKVLDKIVQIESKRGEMPTKVTGLASSIEYYEGINNFISLIQGLGKEKFVRGYMFFAGRTRQEILSSLLKCCYPKKEDTFKSFGKQIKLLKISDDRLVEIAMYAPQWSDWISRYVGWDGLRSGIWFFHAHINERFSAEKETIVAHYSPISPERFNDGAFDMNWFKEVYNTLGKKRFDILYNSAKYISGGANHKRSQYFADAYLGKFDLDKLMSEVSRKRNKNKLLCIGLIPLKKPKSKDLLRRYEFYQNFLKESKKFGIMRRESERKLVEVGLENLARTAGYKDVVRMKWEMESQKVDEYKPFMKPYRINEILLSLKIGEDGKCKIIVDRKDKRLKSIPAKYKKNSYINKLKKIKKHMKEQWERAKIEFESSMNRENGFSLNEIRTILANPILEGIVKRLVLKTDKHMGYFQGNKLISPDGREYELNSKDTILIAHPIHLYKSGKWPLYQKDLFERKITQPFKQVFREIYLKTEDEINLIHHTNRYSGYQVQPKKTAAILRDRGWTVSYYEGLQKVFYQENIVVEVYAKADWFTPADIEYPTIEYIHFYNRQTYETINICHVPELLFSEVMRDLDLVISTAHVGGVDPETSLSTIEMRKAVAKETIRLMKLKNVRIEGKYALVKGELGEYSIHFGSGIVHQRGSGAMYIVPVHSMHRRRIFLPFMDEDPKSTEVITKIVMLANDKQIKDPYILEQIKHNINN